MPRFDITLAGELNLDLILYGLPDELPPERELLANHMVLTLGSSSAIVAHNLAALGSRVGFQSCIGDDHFGRMALEFLAEAGVDTSLVHRVDTVKTGLSVILQREGWRNILTYPAAIAERTWDHLDFDYLTDSRHFHLSSFYLQAGLRPHAARLFRHVKSAGLTTSLDTNDDPEDRWASDVLDVLPYVDVFLPNAREARRIAGAEDLEAAVQWLARMAPIVAVKVGQQGALAYRGPDRFTSPALEVAAVDPVGAGDSFDAGFLHQYVRGKDLATCLATGNVAGALSTTRAGGTEAFKDSLHRETFFRLQTPAAQP